MALDTILPVLAQLIADPIKKYVVAPIKRHVCYAFKCDSNIQRLQQQVEQLQNKKDRLQHSVNDAKRNGEIIFPNVTKWLTAAEEDMGEAEELIQRKDEANNKCFFRVCPNLKIRYQLSKISEKKALAIDKLCNEEGLDPISSQPPLQPIVEPSLYSREALPSRVSMLNQVMDALKDANLHTIGVYGMGGVGKTTLAKEVQAKAMQEKMFETVVMVPVSQTPELRRIQGEIADFLGIKFAAEEIPGRASQLHRRLEKSKVLIILDDLWQKLDLNAVGIPSQGAFEGCCKIIFTSRSRDLLSTEMGAQKLFSLEALKVEESLCLFQMSVPEAKDPQFHHIANEIAKKCGGLPLLVDMFAKDLRNKESYEWNHKLHQLSAAGDGEMYQKVHRVLESSYENLPGEVMKQFFLLCALFGQSNIQIKYLLTHSMGLGLFKHIPTVEAARDSVLTIIDKLKAKSLLLDGDIDGHVKMHDVVRDTALSIASRAQHAFIGTGEVRFRDWQNRDCTRISLPYCDVNELPGASDCPEVEVCLLFTEDLSLVIPDRFFDGMKKLKVVDFRGMCLVSLPSSFGLLTSLQTLCLRNCKLDNIAVLGELKQLEFLSFANSNVVELPRELEALTRLKLLDLQGCCDLRVIHVNLFSRLCSLESLYMLNSFERWNAKGNASLVEFENLARLSTLEIQIPDPKMIPTGFKCFSQLKRYKISIGTWDWKGEPERSRMLKLAVEAGFHFDYDTEFLLRDAEDLCLDGVKGIENLFYEGFPKLKHMHVENDSGIQHLNKSTMRAFPVLESLYLKNLQGLETICSSQLGMGSFGELQVLKINECNKLSSLFSFSSLKCLQKLRELEVDSCANMEAVVGEGCEVDDEGIELTQLSFLKLARLPHLAGFCKVKEETEQIGMLFNKRVSFPNLTSLVVGSCDSLKHIFSVSMVKCLMQLKNLGIFGCDLVEEIIQSRKMEEIAEEDSTEAIVFPKLNYLSLEFLRNVKWFSSCYSIEFPSLRGLTIRSCPTMRNFVGRDSSRESSEEYLFNEMATFFNLETLYIDGLNNIIYIWDEQFIADDSFLKLKRVDVNWCSKLSVVFPSKICTRFQRVETLVLGLCYGVEEIYQGIDLKEVNEPFSLRGLLLMGLPSLKHIWNKESEWNKGSFATFQNLKTLDVRECVNLKYVFPASVGCGLPQLQQLRLKRCNQMEVVIAKAKNDGGGITTSLQFPELKELEFGYLKGMRSLYEGPHTLECPDLKSLRVEGCSEISLGKFVHSVEQLIVDEQGFHALHGYADVSAGIYSKLKRVTLRSLNEETSRAIVFCFLNEVKFLDMLALESCSLEEIFRLHGSEVEQHHSLRVKHLKLRYASKLNYVTNEDYHFNRILQHVQTLNLEYCGDLMCIAPSSTCLQNLTALHVSNCGKMRNLVTASTAKTMVHLVEMTVNCMMIEEIVAKDGDGAEQDVMIIFNKLQRLEFSDLPFLNCFCSDKYSFSLPLLEQVTIKKCPRMKIFCCGVICTPKLRGILFEGERQWEGNLNATIASRLRAGDGEHLEYGRRFQNLEFLRVLNRTIEAVLSANQMQFLNKLKMIFVRDCDSTRVVFDLEGLSAEGRYIELLPQLKILELVDLPSLTQLCSKTPKGILDFSRLKVLKIDNCSRLQYALTWSMASCLSQLQWVEVKNCEMMGTFIMDEEDAAANVTFHELEYVLLANMPNISSIYSGNGGLGFPSLKEVTITKCPRINALVISAQVHSINQVFSKLEELSLSIDMESLRGMMQFEAPSDLFSNLKTIELRHCSATTTSHALLVRFLSRLLNLDQLKLCDSSFQELLNSELDEALMMPHIKSLRLTSLYELSKIWWQASLFQSLETLEVSGCNNLVNFASSSESFQNLVTLTVEGCHQLMNLMTPSMAKSMVRLTFLRICDCKMLMEIVGDGNDQATDEIVFTNLKTLELIALQSLEAFSLTHYNFNFPNLERVILDKCPNLRIFCNGIVNAATLNCVLDNEYSKNGYWEGNLNTTAELLYDKMVGFRYFYGIELSAFPVLKEKWEAQFPTGFLYYLRRLKVDNCELFSNALPSRLLKHLESLNVLVVEKCDSVERVIDLEGWNAGECGTNPMRRLKELKLIDLPRLKQLWSKDPQHILSFKNLQTLKVSNCGSLTYIFNLSMALSLGNLQHLEVKNCCLVEHIILISEEETVQQYQTILPSLQSATLLHLANLVGFCSTSGVVKCLSLKIIEVVDCPNAELFASKFSKGQHSSITNKEKGKSVGIEVADSVSAFLGTKMVMPGLEELKVEWKALKDQLSGNCPSMFLLKLKCIRFTSIQGEDDANFPLCCVRHFPKLEALSLSDSLNEEILFDNLSILKDNNDESLVLLTKLKLSNLPKLKQLVHDDCQPIPLFKNLVGLWVVECSSLKILVPSSVSFQNLTGLQVSKCDGLINLISASTARSLVQLRRMNVKDCKMMREIVAVASDGEEYEIRLSQLEYLELDGLPCLKSFSSGNYDFHFPSLKEVIIRGCLSMKNFAEKVSVPPKLRKVQTGKQKYDWEWEGSLNNTIQALYMQKEVEETAAINN